MSGHLGRPSPGEIASIRQYQHDQSVTGEERSNEEPKYPRGSIGYMFPEAARLMEGLLAERNSLEARLAAVQVERDALLERLDDSFPKSWAGFRAFLDEVYPDDIFPDDDRDLGPSFVVAARRLAAVERERDEALRAVEYFDAQSRRRKSRLAAALARIETVKGAARDWKTCGEHTGTASNRCMLPPAHGGAHDCQLVPGDDDYFAALAAPAATPEQTEECPFASSGGSLYLENLRRLGPSRRTIEAAEAACICGRHSPGVAATPDKPDRKDV
jgi:hypothetical protein